MPPSLPTAAAVPPRPHVTCRRTHLSDWVTLVERTVSVEGASPPRQFHSLAQADYVTVLALTTGDEVALVRQFRPALDDFSLELPGGLLDPGEAPGDCARRELAEEAGLAAARIEPLGVLHPDSGRLENRLWAFLAAGCTPQPGWQPEPDVVPLRRGRADFLRDVAEGRFVHALHVAVVGLALCRGAIDGRG
jgi:ADP-ribose pyrophosphatase